MKASEYLSGILQPLLSHPEDLKITETRDDMGVLLSVDVNKVDMGVIIGKQGETAKAIRLLARVMGGKLTARVSVKINEPEGSLYRPKE